MVGQITSHLNIINKSIEWVKDTESMSGSKSKKAYDNLVDIRRKLKKKLYALEGNPAAAIYGESQVGKSYLISSLLSDTGSPFVICDSKNEEYNFIRDINPHGDGSESTSLVSRFSTSYIPSHPQFPVKAIILSPADMIMVICDSFYSDVKFSHDLLLKSDQINDELADLNNELGSLDIQQNILEEDDILEIRDYFNNYLSKASDVLNSNFFELVPKFISKIESSRWINIFSLLWNKNEVISKLFSSLIEAHQKLRFTNTANLPIEAILNKKGTLLDVKRIKEIYFENDGIEPNYKAETEVLLNDAGEEKLVTISKSFLCALTAEVVINIPEKLLETKSFLKKTDLLDFPGARGRMTHPEELIEEKVIHEMLLRGKVAYLFNKYSDAEKINVLLFCAKHTDPVQRSMPELLNNWVNKIVGDTQEKRELFINKSKVSPLFIIATWFNVNLMYDPVKDGVNQVSSLNYRWNQRFVRSLSDQLLKIDSYDWFEKWTMTTHNFQNIFLLRDFEKSESISQLFRGFNDFGKEREEIKPSAYPNFREKLKQSFLDFDFVKKHFRNPNESWDSSVNINEDGTSLIIDNLSIASENIDVARIEKIQRELNDFATDTMNELYKYYHNSDSDVMLQKAKETAGDIRGNLDIAFGKNPYFFGFMMKELMLPQSRVYNLYLEKIRDIERRDVVNLNKYSAIRINVPNLNPSDNFETNLERLRKHYEKSSLEDCKTYFESKNIDLNELFYGNAERVTKFSKVLADSLQKYWFEHYMTESKGNLSEIFTENGLQDIHDMLYSLFNKLKITEVIASRIRSYVDGYRNIEEVYEMIADISTEIINKFINSIGLDYLSDADLIDLKIANEKNNLELILENNEFKYENNTRIEAANLISKMGRLDELLNKNPLPIEDLKPLPNYRDYINWYNHLKTGFVYVCDIPTYDVTANNQLKVIIDNSKKIKY